VCAVSQVNEYQFVYRSAYISLTDDTQCIYLVSIPEPVLYVTRSDKTGLITLVSSFDFSSQTQRYTNKLF